MYYTYMRLGFWVVTLAVPAVFVFQSSLLKFASTSEYTFRVNLSEPITFNQNNSLVILDRVRGTLSAVFVLAANFGFLLGFVVANYFDCVQQATISMFFPILFFIVFAFVPETPAYLQRCNKSEVSDCKCMRSQNTCE